MPQTDTPQSPNPSERLRAARRAQGLSLSQLAERTGQRLSKSRISNYEQGLRRMSVEAARILAETLGTVSAAWLLGVETTLDLTPEEQDLIARYRTLAPEARQAVRALLNGAG